MSRDHRVALTLLALAIVAVCAFQVPGLLTKMDRARQKKSYFRVWEWRQAVDHYAETHHSMPRPGYFGPISGIQSQLGPISGIQFQFDSKLNPRDGWNNPLIYHASAHHYAIWAINSDGHLSEPIPRGAVFGLESDTIASDGQMVQWPAGWITVMSFQAEAAHPDQAFADFLMRGPNTAECRGCHKAWLEGN